MYCGMRGSLAKTCGPDIPPFQPSSVDADSRVADKNQISRESFNFDAGGLMRILTVLASLLVTISTGEPSTTRIDSLEALLETATGAERIEVLNALSYYHAAKSPERAIELANQALELAEKQGDREGMLAAHKSLAKGYHFSNDHGLEAQNLRKALDQAARHNCGYCMSPGWIDYNQIFSLNPHALWHAFRYGHI